MASSESLDSYIDAAAAVLELRIEPGWKPAVRMNLEVSLKMARMVQQFPLPDEIEPASIYEA